MADISLQLIFLLNHTSRQVASQITNQQKDICVQYNRNALYALLICIRLTIQEGANPYNGTVSFDNIAQAMELVFVIITSNTFTDLMYYSIDAEYMVASLFFIIGYSLIIRD